MKKPMPLLLPVTTATRPVVVAANAASSSAMKIEMTCCTVIWRVVDDDALKLQVDATVHRLCDAKDSL